MRGIGLTILGLSLLLSACGQTQEPSATVSPERAAGSAVESAAEQSVTLAEGTLSLRLGAAEETVEAVLTKDGVETVLPLKLEPPLENYSLAPFSDILGRDGFLLTSGLTYVVKHTLRSYYTWEEGTLILLAESWGFDGPQDYAVDLDGDGAKELVSNVTYGADGVQRSYVYQRREDGIWRGELDMTGLADTDNRGVNAYTTVYNAEKNVFETQYAVKGQEGYTLLETTGLERMTFVPFQES